MMQAVVAGQIENFVKFPPRQKPAPFNLDAVMRDLESAGGAATINRHVPSPAAMGLRPAW